MLGLRGYHLGVKNSVTPPGTQHGIDTATQPWRVDAFETVSSSQRGINPPSAPGVPTCSPTGRRPSLMDRRYSTVSAVITSKRLRQRPRCAASGISKSVLLSSHLAHPGLCPELQDPDSAAAPADDPRMPERLASSPSDASNASTARAIWLTGLSNPDQCSAGLDHPRQHQSTPYRLRSYRIHQQVKSSARRIDRGASRMVKRRPHDVANLRREMPGPTLTPWQALCARGR
jgi:hypothetical protein